MFITFRSDCVFVSFVHKKIMSLWNFLLLYFDTAIEILRGKWIMMTRRALASLSCMMKSWSQEVTRQPFTDSGLVIVFFLSRAYRSWSFARLRWLAFFNMLARSVSRETPAYRILGRDDKKSKYSIQRDAHLISRNERERESERAQSEASEMQIIMRVIFRVFLVLLE